MAKRLDMKELTYLSKKQYPKKNVLIHVEDKEFMVKIETLFKKSEVQELIKEWLEIREACEKANIQVNMYDISFILILKHFTDIPFEEQSDMLKQTEHYIRMTNLLVDIKDSEGTSLFQKVFAEIDPNEIKKISVAMSKVSEDIYREIENFENSEEYKKLMESIGEEVE